MQTHFLEVYIAILCINAGIYVVDDLSGQNLLSPFDTTTVITPATPPTIFNNTDNNNTLSGNFTTLDKLENSTIDPSGAGNLNPTDTLLYPITLLYTFVQFLTGGFIWTTLALFGLPVALTFVLQGIIGFMLVITIVYYTSGR